MPSPFPGMDPFIEGSFDGTMHNMCTTEIVYQLVPRLRPRFIALPQERFVCGIIPRACVEITDLETREVITVIEVLIPEDKQREGQANYLRIRSDYAKRRIAVVEVDFLRRGERTPVPHPLPPMDYRVSIAEYVEKPVYKIWPISLRDRLPVIPIPLRRGDGDVPLDLQAVFTKAYDESALSVATNYSKPPKVSLNAADAAWAAQILSNR
jgi:hypothetical protein